MIVGENSEGNDMIDDYKVQFFANLTLTCQFNCDVNSSIFNS